MADEPSVNENKSKPVKLVVRILTALVTLLLILGAVFLIANWEKLNFDTIRRYFAYRSLSKDESGQAESFSYNGGITSSFVPLGNDLLVCSASGVRLYASDGDAYVDHPCVLTNPILTVGGTSALVYDAGGTDLFVFQDRREVFSLTGDSTKPILCASLSAQGLLTVVTTGSGVRGVVTAYDASFQPRMTIRLSSRFVTDAVLSPDGKTLVLATVGQSNGIFDSQLSFYSLDGSEDSSPDCVCSLGGNTVLELDWSTSPLKVLGDSSLDFVKADGTMEASYSYQYRYLKGYTLTGDGFCSLLLGRYRAGTDAQLVTVGPDGKEQGSLNLDRQVLSLSSAGKYLSVLTADGLDIFSGKLDLYHNLPETRGARKVLQRSDGSVILIAPETAQLYLPQ